MVGRLLLLFEFLAREGIIREREKGDGENGQYGGGFFFFFWWVEVRGGMCC